MVNTSAENENSASAFASQPGIEDIKYANDQVTRKVQKRCCSTYDSVDHAYTHFGSVWIHDAVEVSTVSSRPQIGVIKWNWRDTGKEGGGALFDPASLSNPIHLIHPYFPVSVQFRDLLETYGEPSHIIARSFVNPDDTIAYDLAILYLSQGMLFDAGYGSTRFSLTGMTSLSGPSFFVPTDEGLQSAYAWAPSHPEWLVPWQGMQDFDFYCRDEEGNRCP